MILQKKNIDPMIWIHLPETVSDTVLKCSELMHAALIKLIHIKLIQNSMDVLFARKKYRRETLLSDSGNILYR